MGLFEEYDPIASSTLFNNELMTIGSEGEQSIGGLITGIRNEIDAYKSRVNLSITNFVKKLLIMSRVFIQNKIADDPSLNDNLECIMNQYLAFILAALSLNEDIGNNRTIRKQMEVVTTENYISLRDAITSAFGADLISSIESADTDINTNNTSTVTKADRNRKTIHRDKSSNHTAYGPYGKDDSGYGWKYDDIRSYDKSDLDEMAADDPDFYRELVEKERRRINDEINKRRKEYEAEEDAKEKIERKKQISDLIKEQKKTEAIIDDTWKKANDLKYASTNASISDKARDLSLASGRVIQVELGRKKLNIPVQLLPTVITDQVAESLVSLNFKPGWRQRLVQAKAGEISWFKDFIFEMDLIKKYEEALRKDKTGLLYEMKQKQKNAAKDAVMKLVNDSNRQNIASTIFIFDKQSFMRNSKESGLNWRNFNARERFFAATFSFMVVLIDPIYAKSEYYWSGIDNVGEYNAKNLKAASKKDSYELKDIMAAFTQGHSPRF